MLRCGGAEMGEDGQVVENGKRWHVLLMQWRTCIDRGMNGLSEKTPVSLPLTLKVVLF